MSARERIGVVGTGRIAGTLLAAAARFAPDVPLTVAGRNAAAAADLVDRIPGLVLASAVDLARTCDLVLLAVPPEAYRALAEEIGPHLREDAVLVSLTNGVALEDLAAWAGRPVAKVIPTMAQRTGRGVTLITASAGLPRPAVARVERFLARFSLPLSIDDRDSRIASNVAGSALAVLAEFCERYVAANAAHAVALDRDVLASAMAETLGGLAALLAEGHGFAEIVAQTATPGGVTEAALASLRSCPFDEMVQATIDRQRALIAQAGRG